MIELPLERFNPFFGWAGEKTTIAGREVSVTVHHAREDAATAAARAGELLDWIAANEGPIRRYCAEQLFDAKSSDWTDEEHPPVSRAELEQALAITAVNVQEDRAAVVTVDAADMFWGHWVSVVVTPDRRLTGAYLEG